VRVIDFFADREPWGEFWRLLSVLGADSRYRKAILNDPDAVAAALDEEAKRSGDEKPATWKPAAEDWTQLHELLAVIGDRLGAVAALVADGPVGVKQRHSHPPPYPRPETELDRQRKAREQAKDQAYDDRLLGAVEKAKRRWREQHPDAPAPRRGA
jgi:hypothetical protein